jgi:HEAT repeat protein
VPPLVALLDHEDPAVRAASARVLAAVRDPQAAEPLMRASGDPDGDVRDAAQDALNRLGMMGVVFGVAQLLQPLTERVEGLERALGRGDAPSALPPTDAAPTEAEETP